jgi:hypothetical protein
MRNAYMALRQADGSVEDAIAFLPGMLRLLLRLGTGSMN